MKDDSIAFVCAPFEAEQQLVKLEKDGKSDAVISMDGDCLVLGHKKIMHNMDWRKKKFEMHDQKEAIETNECLLVPCSLKRQPVIASLLRTECADEIANVEATAIIEH